MMGPRAWMMSVLAVALELSGCVAPAPRCTPGLSVACACEGGAVGAQVCRADGTYDRCDCAGGCAPGARMLCLCADGASGTQVCRDEGTYQPCECLSRCIPGSTASCLCPTGRAGSQVCADDGSYDACLCRPGCVDGESRACACADGSSSVQTCLGDRLGPCDCDVRVDAGVGDGGAVASCTSCGCEPPPLPVPMPDLPPLGPIGSVVDGLEVFVAREGYFVRTRTSLERRDRAGAVAGRLVIDSLDADLLGDRLVVIDRETIRWLDLALREEASAPLREGCDRVVALECSRAFCRDAVYDFATGRVSEPLSGMTAFLDAPLLVPGRDTIAGTGQWLRFDPRGGYHTGTSSRSSRLLASVGWPSTTLVDDQGALFDTRGCGAAPYGDALPAQCGEALGRLELAMGTETVRGVTTGPGRTVHALVGSRLLRVDVDTREVVASASVTFPYDLTEIEHDPWGERLLLAGRSCGVCDLQLLTVGVP